MSEILIISDSLAEDGQPFTRAVHFALEQALGVAGIDRRSCHITHVFPFPVKDVAELCGPKAEAIPGMPALVKGKYANASFSHHLRRLYNEINQVNPNLILALGATASWAVLQASGIKSVRGAFTSTHSEAGKALGVPLLRSYKVMPTYHPAMCLRDYTLRPIFWSDLEKASRNAAFPEIIRPKREVWIEPTLEDLARFEREHIVPAERLSTDIETKGDQITCVGFAPNTSISIVIPFYSYAAPGNNYWPTLEEELSAWAYVKRWCETKPSIFQNGIFDMHRLWRSYGISCKSAHDTMLLHHSLQPEMEKGLGFLATLYTEEASWKFMARVDTLKKED